MSKLDWSRIPKFADLPVTADAPPESSWGVFGDDDQIGCLNFLTADGVLEAARLVRRGRVFRLHWTLRFPSGDALFQNRK